MLPANLSPSITMSKQQQQRRRPTNCRSKSTPICQGQSSRRLISNEGSRHGLSTIATQLLAAKGNLTQLFNCVTLTSMLLICVPLIVVLMTSAENNAFVMASSEQSLGNLELGRRLVLESELASLLTQQSSPIRFRDQQDQDWRDKALASAIISHIMLDNLTNPLCDSQNGCNNGQSQALQLQSSNEELDQQQRDQATYQQQQATDGNRLRLLLEQLQLLNNQATGINGQLGNGEFVMSAPVLPLDQMSNIKRTASNRLHSKIHLRGMANDGATGTSGQQTHAHELSLGALKRPDSGSLLMLGDGPSFIKRPSSNNRQFEFGLGKRVASPSYSRYDFGLGKRASGGQINEYRYDFGLGK